VNRNKISQLLRWSFVLVAIFSIGAAPAQPPVKPPVKRPAGPLKTNLSGRLLAKADLAKVNEGNTPASEWTEPPVLSSDEKGELHATLDIRYAENMLQIGNTRQPVRLRSYNNMLTGPTFRVKAGDKLFIHVSNNLPVEPKMEMKDGDCMIPMHGFNVTNLHTHGLHISPSGNSDNVLITIPPSAGKDSQRDYEFDILAPKHGDKGRQYPGTFWYHAHNHGSTSMQLASGMAGALIVEDGPADEVPEVKAAQERLFLLQQFAYKNNAQGIGESEVFKELSRNWRNNGMRTAVNGRIKPLIRMRPGQVERWRMIDSGLFTDMPLVIRPAQQGANFKLYRIAIDGITRPAPEEVSNVELAPGYRVDLLAAAPTQRGTYYLYKQESTLFAIPGSDNLEANGSNGSDVAEAQIVAQIEVAGEPCSPRNPCANRIPRALKPPVDMLPDIKKSEINKPPVKVKFSLTEDGSFFTVNDSCYSDTVRPEFDKTVGDIEEWTVTNETAFPHPFHIHVNAFQLIDESGNPGPWHDTILVPAGTEENPGKITFRTRFERFDGEFVLHCHILLHEDEGMMQKVRVKPKK
jgi:FtsP/CotA-like multicopper oxidase with cupredoxin domain